MNDKKCCVTCPVSGFKFGCNPTLWIGMLVMAVWFLAFEWFWHTKVLVDLYRETPALWRPEADMQQYCTWLWGGIALSGVMAAYIFFKGHEHAGCREGLRYGIIMTLFVSGCMLVDYAVLPISMELLQMWILGAAIQFIVGGCLLSGIFKCCKKHCATNQCSL